MSAALHLAGPSDLDTLLPLVEAYHAFEGLKTDEAHRQSAITPLLEGSPLGCIYLIGPRRAPVGYIVVTFGWSMEFGGMEGFIDEFFVRPSVRGRGVGSEVLAGLLPQLDAAGLRAMSLEANAGNDRLRKLYARAGFRLRDGYHLMTRRVRA